MTKQKFYSLDKLLAENATYNIGIGERSNGKTYAVFKYSIKEYWEHGSQLALIRRYDIDFTGKRGAQMFDALMANDEVSKITGGKWTGVYYRASRWWLCKYDDNLDKLILDVQPFCFAFSLNAVQHDKSTSYPNVRIIFFDEFLVRESYLPDEFVLFMNTLSTIIRQRDDVKIFMMANTVNKYAPYFTEMGLTNIDKMKQGTIDVYKYGNSDLTVAVEYCAPTKKGKKSDKYFAFNNPKLQMITGGAWEIALYPHLPFKYNDEDIKFKYFIVFMRQTLQCEIVYMKDEKGKKCAFTYIHRKTTPLLDKKRDIIFSTEYKAQWNWFRRLGAPRCEVERKLYAFFRQEKVFYQDNEVGEIVRNYLNWCATDRIN